MNSSLFILFDFRNPIENEYRPIVDNIRFPLRRLHV